MPLQMAGCSICHLFIFSSIYRPLRCSHTSAIVNNAEINIRMQLSLKYPVFISFGCVSRREMTGSHNSISIFLRNTFSIVTVPMYVLTNGVQTSLDKCDAVLVKAEEAACWGRYCEFLWDFRDSVAFQCLSPSVAMPIVQLRFLTFVV